MRYQILTGTQAQLTSKVQSALDEGSGWILLDAPFPTGNAVQITGDTEKPIVRSELAQAMYQLTVRKPDHDS